MLLSDFQRCRLLDAWPRGLTTLALRASGGLMPKVKGKADGKLVNELVKEILGS